jgi:putative ribosome biogenesis GTPase RsgA
MQEAVTGYSCGHLAAGRTGMHSCEQVVQLSQAAATSVLAGSSGVGKGH